MKYCKKVCGEQVYLSPMSLDDAELYTKWWNDPLVTDNMGVTFMNNTFLSERDWMEDMLKKMQPSYAIVRLSDDQVIGNVGFENVNNIHRVAEIGMFIGEKTDRGKGYGKEAMQLALDYGFGVLNFNNILLRFYEYNAFMFETYKKMGFKEIGRRRKSHYLRNAYFDEIYMDILQSDWYERKTV
ncbi:N-acetyltransferase [Bacteroidia bacterium]|nr:N-acetyltransferase [Bacteroidia bacterium]